MSVCVRGDKFTCKCKRNYAVLASADGEVISINANS